MGDEEGSRKTDPRIVWLETKTKISLAIKPADSKKFDKGFLSEENMVKFHDFFAMEDHTLLVLDGLRAEIGAPAKISKGKYLCFWKVKATSDINMDNIDELIMLNELSGQNIHDFAQTCAESCFKSVLTNNANKERWGDVAQREMLEHYNKYLACTTILCGQIKGETNLPMPTDGSPEGEEDSNLNAKQGKHKLSMLEGAVIMWTKQIRDVILESPEDTEVIEESSGEKRVEHLTPDREVAFWETRASHLNAIWSQLTGQRISKVLDFLSSEQSTYAVAFQKTMREVHAHREEANDNLKYLQTLAKWFQKLNEQDDFAGLPGLFKPIVHTILLIWKNSDHYNKPMRLVVLVRMICNAVIAQAVKFVSGSDAIFGFLEDEDFVRAVDTLKTALKVCGAFKAIYFDFKDMAANECPQNPWAVTPAAIFVRLNAFMERCMDMLELCHTFVNFFKLDKMVDQGGGLGGTKGGALTETVRDIYSSFKHCTEKLKMTGYDLLDISVEGFDDDYASFKQTVKELERRLAAVIHLAYLDRTTPLAKYKLFESFDSLVKRPLIEDDLEQKYVAVVNETLSTLNETQRVFARLRENPPVNATTPNQPPVAGSLVWCAGLRARMEAPMSKFKELDATMLEREEAKEVFKVAQQLEAALSEYQEQKREEWRRDCQATFQIKLELPLMVRHPATKFHGGHLEVNFAPELVRLLREAKYFLSLGLEIPDTAAELYAKVDTFRVWCENMDMVVALNNEMMDHLLPVEKPLMKPYMDRFNAAVEPGIISLCWESDHESISTYVDNILELIRAAHEIFSHLKHNYGKARSVIGNWSESPMVERKPRPTDIKEFLQMQKNPQSKVYGLVKDSSKELQSLLKHSHHELHLGNTDPAWMSYVNFSNNLVVTGLGQVVVVSLSYLLEQIDIDSIKQKELLPLIEVSLDLVGGDVTYQPDVGHVNSKQGGVRDAINKCIGAVMNVGNLMKRFDNPEGGYIRELHSNPHVNMVLSLLSEALNDTEERLAELKGEFGSYSYLWETDLEAFFAEFKKDATETTDLGQELPNLTKFHEALTKYEQVREDINRIASPTDVGHVRVNVAPIKQALRGHVDRWINVFLDDLKATLQAKLGALESLMASATDGLTIKVTPDDSGRDKLDAVMRTLRDVNGEDEKVAEMFEPLGKTVAMLKKHGVKVDEIKINDKEVNDVLEDAPMSWKDLVASSFRKKEEIFELQKAEQDKIKEEAEVFWQKIREFRTDFRANGPFAFQGEVQLAYDQLDAFSVTLVEMESGAAALNATKSLYDLPIIDYNETKATREELGALKRMWDFKANVGNVYADWKTKLWNVVDTEALDDQNKGILKNLRSMGNENPVMKGWQVFRDIEESIRNMVVVLPLINELHNPSMRQRHWSMLAQTCGVKSVDPTNPKFTLNDIMCLNLHLFVDDVSEVVETAQKELKIETKLAAIEKNWNAIELGYTNSRSSPDIKVIKPGEEVIEGLDADQLELQTIFGMGKFMEFFKDRVINWQSTLGLMQDTLQVWETVTRGWSGLEPIFLYSEDIRSQLPDDTKRFEGIHNEFVELMKEAVNVSNCRDALTVEGREMSLRGMKERLDLCQKSLNEYLDVKKTIFPRFYFVSAVALLDMLANGTNPPKIMPYLGDCYDALANCRFVDDPETGKQSTKTVDMMIAKDKETCPLDSPFTMEGEVENYLNQLTEAMQHSLKVLMSEACDSAAMWDQPGTILPREKWLFEYNCQNGLTTTQIFWTAETTAALEEYELGQEDAVKKYLALCNDRLNKLIELVLLDLKKGDRVKIITLITMDVHSRDVVDKCIIDKIEGPGTFLWQQQLRFYWQESTLDCAIKICDFQTLYFYEWVGNTGRLVITPLTDRCYITLTMALRLFLGGAPAGPAGTGKTETTKDLARAFAIPCYVFNCSDQMNFQTMADIFRGLAQTGAWGCFDEFNRISIEVLSVVASQVKVVQDAIVKNSVPLNRDPEYQHHPAGTPPVTVGFFEFEGGPISLIPTCGFFITMNPGYAGRTELPENLKALFRSCAMIRPDLKPICENMLMSEGFQTARVLAIKFVTLYQLSSELLSKQPHYDWGLRAVKSVLRVAGAMKRTSPNSTEAEILMRALRDFNTPKIPVHDTPVFMRLIDDLFMGLNVPLVYDQVLLKKIARAAEEMKLQGTELFYLKTHQFQELLDVRHSVMLLGPAGCAKTEIWKCLQSAHNLDQPKKVCVTETVNPKSVSGNELYGYMTMSKEWKDGCLSIVMRGMAKCFAEQGFYEYQTYKWVVLDGDIDAVWIESMNTVMDDNKVLTLVSNERVPLSDAMRMVFEINSLKNATPATVSRAGILFINETDVGWYPMVQTWAAEKEDKNLQSILPKLFDENVPKFVEMVRKGYKECTPLYKLNKVETVMKMLDFLLAPSNCPAESINKEVVYNYFMFAAMWAWGGPMVTDKQADYKSRFSEALTATFPEFRLPQEGKCFDYFYDLESNQYVHWKEKVKDYTPIPIGGSGANTPFTQLSVSTVNSVRLTFVMDALVRRARNVMFVGTAGTGKTMLVKEYLKTLDKDADGLLSESIVMSYYTESLNLQAELDLYIDKRAGRIFGPPATKKLIYFIDDMNLPQIETYGTQNAIALLTQQMQHGSVFDREDLSFRKEIVDVQYISAMNPTAGSFTICERAQIRFSTFDCAMPDHNDLQTIYSSIFAGHLMGFPDSIIEASPLIVKAAITLCDSVGTKFLPSAVKFTYNWNMRELTNIFQGICLSKEEFFTHTSDFVRLFIHESERVVRDRLINDKDIEDFDAMLRETVKKELEAHLKLGDHLWDEPRIYTNFATRTDGTYLAVPNMDKLKTVLDAKLIEYNESNAVMDLVLFNQALEHICRIGRILMNPGGNALLIGVGGSGKQSLGRLAAFIQQMEVKQMAITGSFKVDDLKEILKDYFKMAIVKNIPLVWLMTDSQIVNDKFLIYINSMLSSGWISDLFPKDEIDGLLGSIRGEAKAAGVPDTPEANFAFLVKKSRCNFKVILCFSPVGDAFRVRARRFPGLINCTAIDFFHAWPEQALVSVAEKFVADLENIDDSIKANLAQHMAYEHLSAGEQGRIYLETQRRYNYVTPKSFLELIEFYKFVLIQKRGEVESNIDRLDTGLATLNKVKADVDELMVDLKHTLEVVAEKVEKTDALLVHIGKEKEAANVQEESAAREAAAADKASAEAAAIQANADEELKEATPAMEAAAEAVNCLSKAALTELKSFNQCPGADNGNKVMAACLILIEHNHNKKLHTDLKKCWDASKKMMADVGGFLQTLQVYDGRTIPEDEVAQLTQWVEDDPDFNYERMVKSSVALANLAGWVINIYKFNRIYVKVAPLMASLDEAIASKAAADASLAKAMGEVAEVRAKLAALGEQLQDAVNEKNEVEANAAYLENRGALADRLINGLSSEKVRWEIEIEKLRTMSQLLIGDSMLSAGFASYVGGFDAENREALWKLKWLPDIISRGIPCSEGVEPLDLLTDAARTANMINQGLPADRISIENGGIINNCKRWPLIIDPQVQGIKWLRNKEEPNGLQVIQLNSKGWIRTMQNAIANGVPVIVENLTTEIDATLDPVLARAIVKKGRNYVLFLGGEEIEYSMDFRLYLQTKLANPHYKPEIAAQCTLINFIATERGLEDQLLAKVVGAERPDLEETAQRLQQEFQQYKIQLMDLENDLLNRLANAPDDILSDVPLIEAIEATKATAVQINIAIEAGQLTEKQIGEAREAYRIQASEGAMLYFLLSKLCFIDHMYQYSLDSFVTFFFKSITNAVSAENVTQRVVNLRDSLRLTIFTWVARGLFVAHKLIFLGQLMFNLMKRGILGDDAKVDEMEFNFLVRAPRKMGEDNPIAWLPDSAWQTAQALMELPDFHNFGPDLVEGSPRFKEWYNLVTPEEEKLPMDYAQLDKTPFKKMLVTRCLRPDRMLTSMESFIRLQMPNGDLYADCDSTLNAVEILDQSYLDSTPVVPIYFILSPGANVVADLDVIARKYGMVSGSTYHMVSMGQGQDVVAERLLEAAHREGHWVILCNIHLMISWLTKLEKILDDFALEGSHQNFRVFFSSDPSGGIPIGILARCIKLTNEPPAGLKAKLKNAICFFPKELFEEADSKTKSILFGLCYYHGLMLERKAFGPLGYNMKYPFAIADLRDSAVCLQNYMENSGGGKIPWEDLKYIFGDIMYGGHIVNDFDRLMSSEYLNFIMKEELLDETEMYPFNDGEKESFKCPAPTTQDRYLAHINENMGADTPIAFGLHPNAEIDFRTTASELMFRTILELQPRAAGAEGVALSPQQIAEGVTSDILDRFAERSFDVEDVQRGLDHQGPYQNVLLQEMAVMNVLLDEIRRSLKELVLGFKGELTMSDKMEALMTALYMDEVPPSWGKISWPSKRGLTSWLPNFNDRLTQLDDWCGNPMETLKVTWISGFVNPQAFLTAILQVAAQKNQWELDKLVTMCDVLKQMSPDEVSSAAKDGAYICGLFLEGARWDADKVTVDKSRPKELFVAMPCMCVRGISLDRADMKGVYQCPLYITNMRGPTYVTRCQLKTKSPSARWVLAGVALIMDMI